ncbi:hypothetical protein BGX38DRAFT_1139795 [Terfezia claveryi]|nr:hypothetical protein BGX38DRAFT_1139795 [Terfezia claveryi]
MAPGRLFHPVTPGWKDSGRLVVVINGTVYRTLNSYNAFRATEVTRERLDDAIAKGHELLESNPDSIPDFSREGSLDEISEAFKDPETAVLALDPISEQIEYSITVRNHPGLAIQSYNRSMEVPDSQKSDSEDADSDSDSDMGSDNTATPAHHLSPTTPAEDARSLGFEEIPDSQDQDSTDIDTETVFQDCQEPEDTPSSPPFHEFRNEALVDIMSQDDATKDGDETMSRDDSVNDWDSRSALEGDRFDQLEITVHKTVSDKAADTQKTVSDGISAVSKTIADGFSSLAEASKKEKEKTEEHSGILVNIANDVSGHFETQREETKRGLLKLEEAQKEITNLYNNLGMVFNEHMRAQGLELIKLQEHLLAGFHEAVAAIKEEGRVSRAKDSEDRIKLYEAISEVHKETNTIRRAIECADWHPYNTGGSSRQSPVAPKSPSPGWARPPGLTPQPEAAQWPYPHIRPPPRGEIINSSIPSPATTGEVIVPSGIKDTPNPSPPPHKDFIDLSNIPDTPAPSPPHPTTESVRSSPPPLAAGSISANPAKDTAMDGNEESCNKMAKGCTLSSGSRHTHAHTPLECGGAKVPVLTKEIAPPKTDSKTKKGKKERKSPSAPKQKATPPAPSSSTRAPTPPSLPPALPAHAPTPIHSPPPAVIASPNPSPSPVKISPEPGTDTPMRDGDKACKESTFDLSRKEDPPRKYGDKAREEAIAQMMEDTIDSVARETKAATEHKKSYQKAAAKTAAEEQGKKRDLGKVHPNRLRLIGLNPPATFVPQTTVVKQDWDSDSESEDGSAGILAEERKLHLRKQSDRAAKEALLTNLGEIIKEGKRSPVHLAKVTRVRKERRNTVAWWKRTSERATTEKTRAPSKPI